MCLPIVNESGKIEEEPVSGDLPLSDQFLYREGWNPLAGGICVMKPHAIKYWEAPYSRDTVPILYSVSHERITV